MNNEMDACLKEEFLEKMNDCLESVQRLIVKDLENGYGLTALNDMMNEWSGDKCENKTE